MEIEVKRTSINEKELELFTEKEQLKMISLFSGSGGMDLGFEGGFPVHSDCVNKELHTNWVEKKIKKNWVKLKKNRFKTVFANDIRPGAQTVWQRFFKDNYSIDPDIYFLESIIEIVNSYKQGHSVSLPKNVDIITGGFPCQDFSVSGWRGGFESHKNHLGEVTGKATENNRGKLYVWMREVIDIVRPKMFIAENVKGLVSLGDVKKIIQYDFESIGDQGYLVLDGRVLHAADYGVPQSRERVFFYGFNKSCLTKEALKKLSCKKIDKEFDPFPIRSHNYTALDSGLESLKPFVTALRVLSDLNEPDKSNDLDHQNYSKAKWYGKHCQGNTEIKLNDIGPTIRAEHHGNIEFRRLSKEHGGKHINELNKGLKERRLSVRECLRLQTFPDNYKYVGRKKDGGVSASEAYKLIGNAVPPYLAYNLAKRLEQIWDKLFK